MKQIAHCTKEYLIILPNVIHFHTEKEELHILENKMCLISKFFDNLKKNETI